MQRPAPSLFRVLPPAFLFCSLLAIYLRTLAPGLSWANGGTDGGDLIAAAAGGGIAHPTGYPLYLLLARLFQFLPIGSLAYRTNFMSAISTSLAAVLVYEIVAGSRPSVEGISKTFAALAAGSGFGLAPLVWSQAVITEVYALQSLLIALIIYLYCVSPSVSHAHSSRLDYVRGLALGVALSNHVTAILFFPMAFALGALRRQTGTGASSEEAHLLFDWAALRRQLLGSALGLSPYLILPLRAMAHPAVNWGYPVTFKNFWWLVSGQLYQGYYLRSSLPEVWGHVQPTAALLFEQFGSIGVALGVLGLVLVGTRSRLYALTAWIVLTSAFFAFFYRAQDSYLYLIPALLCFAIWVGQGIAGLMHQVISKIPGHSEGTLARDRRVSYFGRKRSSPALQQTPDLPSKSGASVAPLRMTFLRQPDYLRFALGLLAVGYFLFRSIAVIGDVDASRDMDAESFGRYVLSAAPANAILFAEGDRAIFTLWYFHFALGERPDLAIVAADLLHFDWYQQNLHDIYPDLMLPGPFPWPESIAIANPLRTACHVDFTDHAEMECSKALPDP